MTAEVAEAVAIVTAAIERHAAHGYGHITIDTKPDGTILIQEGLGHMVKVGTNGKGREKPQVR